MKFDQSTITDADLKKISDLNNKHVEEVIQTYINLCKPKKVTVITDSQEDIDYVRQLALKNGEETKLATAGHTIHFDGINDVARDKVNTRILVTPDMKMSSVIAAAF